MPEDQIATRRATWEAEQPQISAFEIYPANCAAFAVFAACAMQWERPGSVGGRCTIPFNDLEVAMRMHRVRDRADCFERCVLLIAAARKVMIERHNREHGNG